jgi:hypothetical protein
MKWHLRIFSRSVVGPSHSRTHLCQRLIMHPQDPSKNETAAEVPAQDSSQIFGVSAGVHPDVHGDTSTAEHSEGGPRSTYLPHLMAFTVQSVPSPTGSSEAEKVPEPNTETRRASEHTDRPRQPSSRYPRPWKTAVLRAGPFSGVLSMFIALGSIFACFAILESSNGAAVEAWSVQPSLYLAVFTATANLAMRFACIQGIVVAWWTRALRGSTLSRLHWDWRSGMPIIRPLGHRWSTDFSSLGQELH